MENLNRGSEEEQCKGKMRVKDRRVATKLRFLNKYEQYICT